MVKSMDDIDIPTTSTQDALTEGDFTKHDAPFLLFETWLAEATTKEPNDPNAMSLATLDATGMPNARMVLLKGLDERGFVFYTNLESQKGSELLTHPKAALIFHWKSLRKQVRVQGHVEQVSAEEADEYFESRPRLSRIGAWASRQSRPLEGRWALEKAVAEYTAKFGVGTIPRPPHWHGFRVVPLKIEFWADRPFRLHDRVVFSRTGEGQSWEKAQLYP